MATSAQPQLRVILTDIFNPILRENRQKRSQVIRRQINGGISRAGGMHPSNFKLE